MSRSAFDIRHPTLRPLWRRVALTSLTALWALIEALTGNAFWACLFGGVAAYLSYEFFLVYDPKNYERSDDD